MVLCLRIGTAGLWRLDARWVVTDVSTYRTSFIFSGQLVQECCFWTEDGGTLITETAGTGYPQTGRQILTSVRYSAQVWIAQTVDNCYVKSHCCCTATSVTVSTDVRPQVSVPRRIVWLPAEGNLSFVRGMCQHCSVRCLFYVVVVHSECRRVVCQTLDCFAGNYKCLFTICLLQWQLFNINKFIYIIWKWIFVTESWKCCSWWGWWRHGNRN